MTNEELNQAYAEQLANRRAANCYDIHEAAQAIALQLGLNEYRTEKLRDDMGQAAFDGALTVRSPGGHDQYAPTSPPKTTYGFDSLTTPDDVNQWATERRFTWRWLLEPQATTPSIAPVGSVGASGGMVELDYSVLATPAALLDAFEKWGMKAAWFDELDSHKWLLDARRQKGQGQRGNVIPPMFCPYAVMCGLVNKVRKATRLKPDTAWRTLEHKFPKVHAAFESHDTRDRTGD